jgi:hypothetical protein
MVAGVKKNGFKALFILLGIVGMALIKNSGSPHQENVNILACAKDVGCPDSGLDGPPAPKPKGPKCPCLTPRLPKA